MWATFQIAELNGPPFDVLLKKTTLPVPFVNEPAWLEGYNMLYSGKTKQD